MAVKICSIINVKYRPKASILTLMFTINVVECFTALTFHDICLVELKSFFNFRGN